MRATFALRPIHRVLLELRAALEQLQLERRVARFQSVHRVEIRRRRRGRHRLLPPQRLEMLQSLALLGYLRTQDLDVAVELRLVVRETLRRLAVVPRTAFAVDDVQLHGLEAP